MSKPISKKTAEPDTYFNLIKKFPLKPITNDDQLDAAIEFLNKTMSGPSDQGTDDYVDVLSDLIGKYEDEHVIIEYPGDAAMLQHLMESRQVNQADVSKSTGIAKSTISEVLSGKRQLTRPQVATLAKYFKVDQGVFALVD